MRPFTIIAIAAVALLAEAMLLGFAAGMGLPRLPTYLLAIGLALISAFGLAFAPWSRRRATGMVHLRRRSARGPIDLTPARGVVVPLRLPAPTQHRLAA